MIKKISKVKIKEIMNPRLITIDKGTPIRRVAQIFHENKISGAPVVDETGKALGVITLNDITKALGHWVDFYQFSTLDWDSDGPKPTIQVEELSDEAVEQLMTPDIFAVDIDSTLKEAVDIMVQKGFHRVFVSQDNKLVGIVSSMDILKLIHLKY